MTTSGIMKRENGRASVPATSFSGLVDQFFQNNLNRFFEDSFWGFDGLSQQSNIPVNLKETENGYDLQLIAPGLRKEDFKISVDGDLLTISFEQKEENKEENKNQRWLKKEYRLQSFSRSFTLDDSFDANKISAGYTDGVLHLTLPKKEGMQRISRNIEIK